MTEFTDLLTPKDTRVVNKDVFEWLETNTVTSEIFCAYLERIKYDHDMQCGAAVDCMCENILKKGNTEQIVNAFAAQVRERKKSLYPLMVMALDLNKNINTFLNTLLDQYGVHVLKDVVDINKFPKLLWNRQFLSNPSLHTILKYNPAFMLRMMEQWDDDNHPKGLRILHKFGVLNAEALIPYLNCLGGEEDSVNALVRNWDVLFPAYTQGHIVEIARVLPKKAFENFIAEKHVDVEQVVPILKMWQEKSLDLSHPRVRELLNTVEWNEERFNELFNQSVTERLEKDHYKYSAHLEVFVNIWLNNASEENWHYIAPYVRNSGVEFRRETQDLIEHMNILNAVEDVGVPHSKRKI